MAGQQKSIRGHFTFFETDQNHIGGVANYLIDSGANPLIYCVIYLWQNDQETEGNCAHAGHS